MNHNHHTYDVVIIGAGVAGCATAIALKNESPHLKVAIIERNVETIATKNSLLRIGETLPPHTSQQLQHLNIWESFLDCGFIPSYGTSAAWGSAELYHNEYLYSPYGYGWHLNRKQFDTFLINAAKQRGVTFLFNSSITSSKKEKKNWILSCISKLSTLSISTYFVVDATGKKAVFSSLQNVTKVKEDHLVGIYQFYDSKDITDNTLGNGTCVETDPYGWWYSATLPDHKLVVTYLTDADIANDLLIRKKESFDHLVHTTNYTRKRINNTSHISEPKVVAAHSQYLSSATGDSWLSVGDAASSYDPISSLGIFKSLAMSRLASYAILDDQKGITSGLKKYQKIITNDYKGYLKKRQEYYAQEKRFQEFPFWKRRHANQITN